MELNLDQLNEMKAHKAYSTLALPKRFSLQQIDTFLQEKYGAVELDKKLFPELERDPYFHLSHVTTCYVIQEEAVLQKLYTEEEKSDHLAFIKQHGKLKIGIDHANAEQRIHAISQGSLLYLFFQSEDGQYIGSFASIHGSCEKIACELLVWKGIDPEDCVIGNMNYKIYLAALLKAGYMSI